MAATVTGICNLALQKLGAKRIDDIDQDTRNAIECKECYELLRDKELRAHRWIFATKEVSLAPLTVPPAVLAFSRDYVYQLPSDCLRLLPPQHADGNYNWRDWIRAGNKVYSDEGDELVINYIARVEDPSEFDSTFVEALACKIAHHLCWALLNSNTRKADIEKEYKMALNEAKRTNALERIPEETTEDTWISVRR